MRLMTLVSIQPICIGMVQAPFLFELCTRARYYPTGVLYYDSNAGTRLNKT